MLKAVLYSVSSAKGDPDGLPSGPMALKFSVLHKGKLGMSARVVARLTGHGLRRFATLFQSSVIDGSSLYLDPAAGDGKLPPRTFELEGSDRNTEYLRRPVPASSLE